MHSTELSHQIGVHEKEKLGHVIMMNPVSHMQLDVAC